MPRKSPKKQEKEIKIEAYSHAGKKRKNNPPVGLVSSQTDKLNGYTKYAHDPYIDPYLSWAGKKEGQEVNVRNISLHVHERIDSTRVIRAFLKKKTEPRQQQLSLFQSQENTLPLGKAFEFYSHDQDWTNRLIAGDSLLVMNSLLKKEGMAGEVQMVYIDPPYGIKYNSNFQPFINKREVKDNNDADIPAEPETIKAFRDTWELGIHSYLTYLYDRLLLAKELLNESGSCFVQINDENVHHVKEIMDEVFGKDNFVSLISFATTSGFQSSTLSRAGDYVCWYAKDKKKIKYRPLYLSKVLGEEGATGYDSVELKDGAIRSLTKEEIKNPSILPEGSRLFAKADLTSSGKAGVDQAFEFEGKTYRPNPNSHWKANYPDGMQRLANANRLVVVGNTLRYKRYFDDFSLYPINNFWSEQLSEQNKTYVVQTSEKVIARCLLMATDPGDLVIDPTCGSGTTAFVAEKWGRRWISCDTSRVSIALAKQRLMTAYFDYYKLAHQGEGVSSGFEYKKVPHITLGSIANNEPAAEETLYDQPVMDKSKVRVTGPFTVEALPSLRTKPFDGKEPKVAAQGEEIARTGETANQAVWRDELKTSGIRATGGKTINFSRIEPMAGTRFIHAEAEILDEKGTNKKAVISFGPDYGALEQRQVEEAVNEARKLADKPDFIIFAAFQFDPEAAKDIDHIQWPGVTVLKAQMSVDLLTADLRKKRSSNQSYWLIGQPDVEVVKNKDGTCKVIVRGFDYYNPVTGEIDFGDTRRIAMWMLDSDYDEQSILPEQVFFPMKDPKHDWTALAKTLNGAVDQDLIELFTGVESLPFAAGEHKKIAVKIIDDRGIESFVIKNL
ncbi:site-specific DNA-methyltransferase [Patescibacteria group bacterium]|nr:site-specific DNA-methyltransferase [Patescibacteria group bacterium]MDL1953151.1 site-specific DNA-methyltransferase [Candidatus Uhrbacteria bacterium UHB]RIL00393.1 MAG: site-specific DNA-methyltransferase [Candidatus Uhrbacteria bacterium]